MIQLKVNGVERSFDGDPEMPVLWYLRDVLGLTGTKFGCGMALCGACTVLQNGEAIRSCVVPVRDVLSNTSRTNPALSFFCTFTSRMRIAVSFFSLIKVSNCANEISVSQEYIVQRLQ